MDQKFYTPLHVHSEFSLLDGALRIEDYVAFAKEQKWPAIALTDHGNIFGAVKLFQLSKKAGIKPIVGAEMYFIPDAQANKNVEEKYFHLTVLVASKAGYTNLCRLFDFAYTKGFYFKPRIDYDSLERFSEGLIIGSGCLGGHISKLARSAREAIADERIEWFMRVFGKDRFFLEVQPAKQDSNFERSLTKFEQKQEDLNKFLFSRGEKYGLRVVASSDSHYLKPEHRDAHEIMLSIGTKDLLANPERFSFGEFRGHLKGTQEMLDAFPNNPEVVYNSGIISQMCDFEFEFGKLHFPQFEVEAGKTQESLFKELCLDGLEEIFQKGLVGEEKREKYFDRLNLEIDLITKMGFVGYFLVVGDFISWSKKQGISVGPGRGSVAGSLVSWALKITNIDPIEYNLLFERFLNPERISMPDIDIDFCIEGRERVIDYVREKYGHDCVCQIITFGTMMAKGVIKDVSRVLGFPFKDSNAITDLVPDQLKISLDEAIKQEPRLKKIIDENPKAAEMIEVCRILEGLTRHASKHAAGVVISPEPIREVLPLFVPQKSTDLVAQYSMGELESLGYLKMDFLGLKNLTVIDRAIKAIKERRGIEIDLDTLPRDDKETFKMLSSGKTCGIFQFEGDGVTEVIKRLKPEKFEDLIALNALYRPGPLGSGMVEDFIEGRHGRKIPTYAFPELEAILSETYGVIVYQEQVMKVASAIAGYSLGSADILRRAMGKKKADVMAEQKKFFVQGATGRGFDREKSEKLFDLMAYFAGYGFNKSHSAAYALIAYQTAFLKTHYAAEFEAAILSFETSDPDKLREYLNKAKQAGVKILPPDINRSRMEFWATDVDQVIFGIKGIKNVGEAALQEIFAQRAEKPFVDLADFCKRVNLRTVNKRVIESLICSGAMDVFPGTRAQKMAEFEDIMSLAQQEKDRESKGQIDLFRIAEPEQTSNGPVIYKYKLIEDWTRKTTLEKEKEVVGFYLSSHPLDSYKELSMWLEAISMGQATEPKIGRESVFLGVITSFKAIMTKKGDRMAFAVLEDQSGEAEVIIFPKLLSKVEDVLSDGQTYVVIGQVDAASSDKLKIKARELILAESFFDQNLEGRILSLTLPEGFDCRDLNILKDGRSSRGAELNLIYSENGKSLKIKVSGKYGLSFEVAQELCNAGFDLKISFPPPPAPRDLPFRRWEN